MGKARILKVCTPGTYTQNKQYDRDLKNTDVVVNHKRVSVHNILKELGDKITKSKRKFFSILTLILVLI
jgi:pSer/pThr/pTyr-binding forkhead associated (FHA) protein